MLRGGGIPHAVGNVQPAPGRLDVGRALAVLAFGDGVAAAGQQGVQLCLLAVKFRVQFTH